MPRKEDLSNLDIYVKWPQLEDALTKGPGSRPSSGRSPTAIYGQSEETGRPISARSDVRQTSPHPPCRQSDRIRPDSSSSNRSHRSYRSSRPSSSGEYKQDAYQPSENVIKRLNELGMLTERQNSLMDALERARVSICFLS